MKFIKSHPRWVASLTLSGVIGFCLLIYWWGWFGPEPKFHGRSVSYWLRQIHYFQSLGPSEAGPASPEVFASDPGLKAIRSMGPDAIPTLVQILSIAPAKHQSNFLDETYRWLDKNGIPFNQRPLRPIVRIGKVTKTSAGFAILAIGKEHGGGMAVLLNALAKDAADNSNAKHFGFLHAIRAATDGLPDRKNEITAGLIEGLKSTNSTLRYWAFQGVMVDYQASIFKQEITRSVYDPDPLVAATSMNILVNEESGDPRLVLILEDIVGDAGESNAKRIQAANSLAILGANAVRALPLLAQLTTTTTNTALHFAFTKSRRLIEDQAKKNGIKTN